MHRQGTCLTGCSFYCCCAGTMTFLIISLQDPVKVGVVLSGGQVRAFEEIFLPMVSYTKHYEALYEA